MGFSQSRFLDALRRGSEEEALALYNSKKSVRDSVEPNASLGLAHEGNSVLHYAARHGMVWLYCNLSTRGGKPDLRNGLNQNCLHLVCGASSKPSARKAVLQCALEEGLSGMDVSHVLQERDEEGNTALHLAASSGLMGCVEVLLAHGSDPFLTNKMEQTAADCATGANHNTIATHLETRMVFSTDDGQNPAPPVEPDHTHLIELAEAPTGMRDSDIRSMKDVLLIETSELLGVSLFVAEALLKHHGWSKESLVEEWIRDAAATCERAGVQLPQSLGRHNLDGGSKARPVVEEERECGVCALPYRQEIVVPCGHVFCRSCWRDYLHIKIECGDIHSITCPEYGCYKMVPVDVIEEVVSRNMAQRYLHFDIKAFVDSNPNIRWCPHPNCHRAVHLSANADDPVPNRATQPSTVQCGSDHYFCWMCAGDPHDPCDCETWQRWLQYVEAMRPRIGQRTSSELDNAATQKWLAKRSKPCPKCHAPIERTEGCNHMCCRKCKHDFCWVCLDEWKQHNSSTGGYFECNRYDVRKKANTMLQERTEKVMEGLKEVELLRRFMHYYERYSTHRDSLALEQPFLQRAHHKMVKLLKSVSALDGAERGGASEPLDLSFIEEAVRELLAARRVLIASYPFGYYIQGSTARRAFENMQGALEEVTELMAQVVARPHLRKPRLEIIRLTRECREKRIWLLKNSTALPRPSPPARRRPKHRSLHKLPDDSESSSGSSDGPTDERFLDQFRRRASHSRASQASAARQSRQEELELLLLQMSRLDYEEQRQLQADIELAKELSLQEEPTTQPAPTPAQELQFLGLSSTLAASSSSGMEAAPLTLSVPCQGAGAGPGGGGTSPISLSANTATAGSSCADRSSPSNGGPASEEEQQGWEDEELARALSLSLLDQQTQQSQQERGTGDWMNLPPELRHLLQDGDRSGQSV